jgi:amino acid adenylation domain-containing protein
MSDLRQRIANLSPEKRALLERRLMQQGVIGTRGQTIPRRDPSVPCPLSFAQQRLWFLAQLDPNSPHYNEPKALRMRGELNVPVLQRALEALVARHEVLRTTIAATDGQPFQVIAAPRSVPLPVLDLRPWPEATREAEAHRQLSEASQQPFDLSRDLMLRALLLRLSDAEHILLLVTHHIASDGWSTAVLMRETAALYEAFASGKLSPLPELPIQYADFALWQRQWLQGEVLEAQITYWRRQLADMPAALELPADRLRPAVQTYRGARHSFTLPLSLAAALKTLSRREGVTLFMTLLAAFQTLLHRYTEQDDLVVGSPIAGRNWQETEGLIGFFVNTLVLRTNLSGNPTFRELLGRVRKVTLEAYGHQDLPFEKLVEELQPERNLSHSPMFQVMFALHNEPRQDPDLPGLSGSRLQLSRTTTKFDLSLSMADTEAGLIGSFVYSTDLFEASTIGRLLGHWQTLLEGIVACPDQPIATLPLLTTAERQQLHVDGNPLRAESASEACIHQLFEARAAHSPEAVAVMFAGQQLTYRELNRQANRLAHLLQQFGVGPDVLVGLYVERSIEMVIGLLGILKAGGAYLPLDPTYPQDRLAFMLHESQPAVVLTQQKLLTALPQSGAPVLSLDIGSDALVGQPEEPPVSRVTADHLAYVIYTSGTSGQPKGVMVQHRALVNYSESASAAFALTPNDRVLQFASITFDTAAEEVFPCLIQGATLVLRTDAMLDSVAGFLQQCRDWELTVLDLPTAYWHDLTAHLVAAALEIPPAVRLVIIGGERVLVERLATWHEHVPQGVRLVNTYGPTETTIVATMGDLVRRGAADLRCREVTLGQSIRNVQTYVLDRYLQPVPIGVPGELYIGGLGVARGYLRRPELTAAQFLPHPFSDLPGARLYKTGDRARHRPDGSLEFLGRLDQQVKIRGFRVELQEIETVLSQYPGVHQAVALAREDIPGETRLVAYVVPTAAQALTHGELRHFLQQNLPAYMIPAAFVMLAAMPLTPNGKVDRRALPAPSRARPDLEEAFLAPQTPVEAILVEIWSKVLGVDRVGIRDNFFALGGHSLLATQVMARLCTAFQVDLPLRILFERPTIEALAVATEDALIDEIEQLSEDAPQ